MRIARLREAARPQTWSVRTRLGAASTLAATVGLTLAGTTAYVATSRLLHEQLDDSLRGSPMAARPVGPAAGALTDLCKTLQTSSAASPALFTLTLIAPDGTTCSDPRTSSIVLKPADRSASRPQGSVQLRDGVLEDGSHVRVAVMAVGRGETVVIARDATPVDSVLTTLKLILLGVIVLGAVTALAMSRRIAGAALRPITRFARIAEEVAETGNLEKHVISPSPVPVGHHGDELDRLSHAFMTMTTVLSEAWARQRRLVADAGHELRTPLSSIRSNVELLRRTRRIGRSLPPGEEERLLEDLDGQVTEMSHLVNDLVDLSTAETQDPEHEAFRFDHCVEQALARARRRTTTHTFAVHLEPWTVQGDEAAVERAVVNLLDNAIKFSPPGQVIEVELVDGVLTVTDHGTGIPPGDAARAFERFWRAPEARSLPGSGLGLSIVGEVASRHGGEARLEARPRGGTIARFTLPRDGSSSPENG